MQTMQASSPYAGLSRYASRGPFHNLKQQGSSPSIHAARAAIGSVDDSTLSRLMSCRLDTSFVVAVDDARPITALAFSNSACGGNLLAAAADSGSVVLSDTRLPGFHHRIAAWPAHHANAIFDLAWSADDAVIATASGDHSVLVVDSATGVAVCSSKAHKRTVKAVRFVGPSSREWGGGNNGCSTILRHSTMCGERAHLHIALGRS